MKKIINFITDFFWVIKTGFKNLFDPLFWIQQGEKKRKFTGRNTFHVK